jgi:hypothetical protein
MFETRIWYIAQRLEAPRMLFETRIWNIAQRLEDDPR